MKHSTFWLFLTGGVLLLTTGILCRIKIDVAHQERQAIIDSINSARADSIYAAKTDSAAYVKDLRMDNTIND